MRAILSVLVLCALAGNVSAQDWQGTYEGPGEGGRLSVVMARTAKIGTYAVSVEVLGPRGCGGQVQGEGVARGDTLSFTSKDTDATGPDECKMAFRQRGRNVSVRTLSSCTYFHGAACGFDGRVTRR